MHKVRGKIVSCALLAIILGSVMLAATGLASPSWATTISVEPDLIKNPGFIPGDTFSVNIMISNVENLYAWGFWLGYSPIRMVLDCVGVSGQKEFLGKTGLSVFAPAPNIDIPHGEVYVSATLVGAVPPGKEVSGDGKLATITFKVMEAGECALDLHDETLLIPNPTPPPSLIEVPHLVKDGYYLGPKAELVRKELPLGRDLSLSKRNYQTFLSSVKSVADVPLYVKVKFHMVREDGKIIDLWAMDEQYLPVDGYLDEMPIYVKSWTSSAGASLNITGVGTQPWLGAVDGQLLKTSAYYATPKIYGEYLGKGDGSNRVFWCRAARIPILLTWGIANIYTTYPPITVYLDGAKTTAYSIIRSGPDCGKITFTVAGTPGPNVVVTADYRYRDLNMKGSFSFPDFTMPADEKIVKVELETYAWTAGPAADDMLFTLLWDGTEWLDLTPGIGPMPSTTPGWMSLDVTKALDTVGKINGAKIVFEPCVTTPPAGWLFIDAARLKITLVPSVQPGKVLEMPAIQWTGLTTLDVATYYCEAICYYSYTTDWFNKGLRTSTFKWWIVP